MNLKTTAILLTTILFWSCSQESVEPAPAEIIDGYWTGGFWTYENGDSIAVHEHEFVMPPDSNSMTITLYSLGTYTSQAYATERSGNLNATLLDTDMAAAYDSITSINEATGQRFTVYKFRQRLLIETDPMEVSHPGDYVKVHATSYYLDGYNCDFRIVRGE